MRSCGCLIPGSVQGWSSEKCGLVEGVLSHGKEDLEGSLRSFPSQAILWFYDSVIFFALIFGQKNACSPEHHSHSLSAGTLGWLSVFGQHMAFYKHYTALKSHSEVHKIITCQNGGWHEAWDLKQLQKFKDLFIHLFCQVRMYIVWKFRFVTLSELGIRLPKAESFYETISCSFFLI